MCKTEILDQKITDFDKNFVTKFDLDYEKTPDNYISIFCDGSVLRQPSVAGASNVIHFNKHKPYWIAERYHISAESFDGNNFWIYLTFCLFLFIFGMTFFVIC